MKKQPEVFITFTVPQEIRDYEIWRAARNGESLEEHWRKNLIDWFQDNKNDAGSKGEWETWIAYKKRVHLKYRGIVTG